MFAPKATSYGEKAKPLVNAGGFAVRRFRRGRCMTQRHFTPPWIVEDHLACFIIKDNNGQALAYVYYEEEPGQQAAAKQLSKDEARRIATNFARLPELLRAQPHWR